MPTPDIMWDLIRWMYWLTGYDTRNVGNTRYCILQIVRQPWKYVMVTGILMMLAGAVLLFINGPKKVKS